LKYIRKQPGVVRLSVPALARLYCTVLYCKELYCVVLYSTVLYCTVLYCNVLYRTVVYRTVLYRTVLYCTVPYCTVPYCTVPYCTVLYCTVLYFVYCILLHCTVPQPVPAVDHCSSDHYHSFNLIMHRATDSEGWVVRSSSSPHPVSQGSLVGEGQLQLGQAHLAVPVVVRECEDCLDLLVREAGRS
jgi:hypothetical protein